MPAIVSLEQVKVGYLFKNKGRIMMIWKLVILIVVTAGILYISRSSLRNTRSHGFFRFFAWETILILFLLNVSCWFVNSFAWYQIISWILLFLCIVPVVWGTLLLHKHGKPVVKREEDPSLLAFEKTTTLVQTGIFLYIRHPLYSSLLLLSWGIFFKLPSWVGGAMALVASGFLFLTAQADETECIKFFGSAYEAYMKTTKRFIPYIF
jgi:protein-S-isoprenylcysteine O-methyltransferase Ste14